ncbi:hypothetical protein OOZ15_18100 [Galbibacter sp. EGI 63066]|uniref:hypothetical protein n=1 Tax=Galbibacter sp. EGI 63066 TaxID=2993559 RepID=UPI002248FC06|nr:hypothetical protein [Galbibacter sp. EGI 63066]MCX2681871.1 hypothetical protein [Galbibacter sp. EGI 63066]
MLLKEVTSGSCKKIQSYIEDVQYIKGLAKDKAPCKDYKKLLCSSRFVNIIGEIGLNILEWKFEGSNSNFTLLSSNYGYGTPNLMSFKRFLESVKKCFVEYFTDVLLAFMQSTNTLGVNNRAGQCLQFFMPLALDYGQAHYYVALYICPINNGLLYEDFYYVAIPLKKYESESVLFSVLVDMKRNSEITKLVRDKCAGTPYINNILTRKQITVFNLIMENYSSRDIAKMLGKSHSSILKYNIRISSLISDFFEKPFNTVYDAVAYYKKCFCVS